MIIPPSPTTPRSPIRRAMRIAGVVAAPVLLVAAVAVGLAGPKPEPPAPAPTVAPPAAVESPAAGPSAEAAASPDPAGRDPGTPAAPRSFAGLNAVTPSEAISMRAAGHTGPLVIRGQLKLAEPDGTCDGGVLGPLGPWCARTGILAERAWTVSGADFDPLPAHLHVTLPVGVRAPDVLARMAVATAGSPLPVVVVGRFTGSRCAPGALARCQEPFVVDRVTWADGVVAALTPLAEDLLRSVRRQPNPFQLAVAARQSPLLAVLAWPATVAEMDPATADAITRLEPSDPVWYLRVLEGEGQGPSSHGGTPAVHWYLLDERLLAVIATGDTAAMADPASVPAARTAGVEIPSMFANLGVRTVGEARAAAAAVQERPIAVAGRLRGVRAAGECTGPGDATGTWCARIASLEPGRGAGALGSPITVRIPPGVRIPATDPQDGDVAEPVVVVGHLRPVGSCGTGPDCDLEVRAERVAAAGAGSDVRPVMDRGIPDAVRRAAGPRRPLAESLAAGLSGAVLASTLVRSGRLEVVDPAASAAVGATLPPGWPLWYVTAVQTDYGTRRLAPGDIVPRITWVVVDARSGQLYAAGVR